MGRPLKGSIHQSSSGNWTVSVPREFGSPRRQQVSFPTEQLARAWLAAALGALKEKKDLPDPHRFSRLHAVPPRVNQLTGNFAEVAWACWREEFDGNLTRTAEASVSAEAIIRLWLVPFFEAAVNHVSEIRRDDVKEFIKVASGRADFIATQQDDRAISPRAYPRRQQLNITQVVDVTGYSKASILRYFKAGKFPHASREDAGPGKPQIRIPFGDVLDEGLTFRGGPPTHKGHVKRGIGSGGAARRYQREMLWTLRVIVTWAIDKGLMEKDPTSNVQALEPKVTTAITRPSKKQPTVFTIAQCAAVAKHLHTHHQVVMWIQRILGLRVSEVFGLRLSDFYDLGELAVVDIHRQGGRSFWVRDENDRPVKVGHKDSTKTVAGNRTLVVPRQLAEILRTYIRAYHVDPVSGAVNPERRLIVGLRDPNKAGVGTYTSALQGAFIAAGLGPLDVEFSAGSHHLRKSLSTDIRYQTKVGEAIRSEWIGHRLTGQGGGATITMTAYTLKMPVLAPLEEAAKEIEAIIEAADCRLFVPSAKKPTYSSGHYLREPEWQRQVEAVLADAEAAFINENFLTIAEAASFLNLPPRSVRKLIHSGKLESVRVACPEATKPRYLLEPEIVEALRDSLNGRLTVAEASAELGIHIATLYRAIDKGLVNVEREGMRIYLRQSELIRVSAVLKGPEGLSERAMTLVEAALELKVEYSVAKLLVKVGTLVTDPESPSYPTYVTRSSVAAEKSRRFPPAKRRSRPHRDQREYIDLPTAIEMTGLSRSAVLQLTHSGVFFRRSQYEFLVDRASLEAWLDSNPRLGQSRGVVRRQGEGLC